MDHPECIVRTVEAGTVEVSARKRTVRAIWSNDLVDAHRTAFDVRGFDTARYDNNPILLWEHGQDRARGRMPVANAVEYGADRFRGRDVFIGVAKFWDDDEFAGRLFERYAAGQVRGWSINGEPLSSGPPTRDEVRARPDWAGAEIIFRSLRLLEVSATALPSNPSSLTLSVERRLGGPPVSRPRPPAVAIDPRAWTDPAIAYAEVGRLSDLQTVLHNARVNRAAEYGADPREAATMSDEELQTAIARMKLETAYLYMLNRVDDLERRREQLAAYERLAAEEERDRRGYARP